MKIFVKFVSGRYVSLVFDDVSTGLDLHAMWSDGQGNTYAVGGVFAEPFDGVALLRSAR